VVIPDDVERSNGGDINKMKLLNMQDHGDSPDLDSKHIWKFYDPFLLAYK
jgi:hypothetical protein